MTKTNKFFTLLLLLLVGFSLTITITAQKPKPKKKADKKASPKIVVQEATPVMKGDADAGGTANGGSKSLIVEPYLGLEPCAKETPEQISELETASDKNKQLEILVKRIGNENEWLRACSVYRLGEFRTAAQPALPVILKLLRDEENSDVWRHVETALWKIPPQANIPLQDRMKMAHNLDVYIQLYGIYSLSYFKPVLPTDNASKQRLETLMETARSEDITVAWLSVLGIRQLGFYGVDISSAIPLLSDLLKKGQLNSVNIIRAFVPMGEKGLSAVPLLLDVLYNPENYVGKDKDEDTRNIRRYSLYLTSAIALGRMGKVLIPLLEKEVEKEPYAILQVLSNMAGDETLPILYKIMEHKNPEVRKKAIESLPGFTSIGAVIVLPKLIKAVDDSDIEVRKSAMNKIGNIGRNLKETTPELREMIEAKVVPGLLKYLNHEDLGCYAKLNIAYFKENADTIIPHLAKVLKKGKGTYCAEVALFRLGENGRKHLTEEQIRSLEKSEKDNNEIWNRKYNNAKPIEPKKEEEKDKDSVILEKET